MNMADLAIELHWLLGLDRAVQVDGMLDTLLRRVEAGTIAPGKVTAKLEQFCPDAIWVELKSAARAAADLSVLDEGEDEDDDASWHEAYNRAMAAGLLSWLREQL